MTGTITTEDILALIARARDRTKLTQKQLSKRLGYSEQYLQALKSRGTLTSMPVRTLLLLAALAGQDITVTPRR